MLAVGRNGGKTFVEPAGRAGSGGKDDGKDGSPASPSTHTDASLVSLDGLVDDGQAEAGSMFLGGVEEGVEQA